MPPHKKSSPAERAVPVCDSCFNGSKKSFLPRMEREYTVGPSQTADTAYPLFGGHPRNRLASSAPGGASPVSPSWVISAPRAALRRLRSETRRRAQSRAPPLHPQGVCGIRKAAEPLTAALPYRCGESTTLSTISGYSKPEAVLSNNGNRSSRMLFFCDF